MTVMRFRSFSRKRNINTLVTVAVFFVSLIGVESENCAATLPKFDDRRPFGTLAFRNGLEERSFDFRRVIDNHRCISCRNLVRFGSLIMDFKT